MSFAFQSKTLELGEDILKRIQINSDSFPARMLGSKNYWKHRLPAAKADVRVKAK